MMRLCSSHNLVHCRMHPVTVILQYRIISLILPQKLTGIGNKCRISGVGAAFGFYENAVIPTFAQHQQTMGYTVCVLIHPLQSMAFE